MKSLIILIKQLMTEFSLGFRTGYADHLDGQVSLLTRINNFSFIKDLISEIKAGFIEGKEHWKNSNQNLENTPINPNLCTLNVGLLPESLSEKGMLVVADMLPLFDFHSGSLRLKTLIGMLTSQGWDVTFGSILAEESLPDILKNPEKLKYYETALENEGVKTIIYGELSINKYLERLQKKPKWVFLSFPSVASRIIPAVRMNCPSTKIIYDMVDFHYLRLKRWAEIQQDESLMIEAEKMADLEFACVNNSDITIAISEVEKCSVLSYVNAKNIQVLPNVFEIPKVKSNLIADREGIVFIGGFWHPPNEDAIIWFVNEVWPIIRKKRPDVSLSIVGSNPTKDVVDLGKVDGVKVFGFVLDLAPILYSHRLAIAPLRYGAGMKGKVGQSLAYGLPLVTTSVGAEGMDLVNGEDVFIADNKFIFAKYVIKLIDDDELWQKFSKNGIEFIKANLSPEVIQERLRAILNG